jgi:hypothetical protein
MIKAIQNGILQPDLVKLSEEELDEDIRSVCETDSSCALIFKSVKNVLKAARMGTPVKILEALAQYTPHSKKTYSEATFLKKDYFETPAVYSWHSNPQCRLDTVKNAYFQQERPRCWYSENPDKDDE